jgi:hypothetical protein
MLIGLMQAFLFSTVSAISVERAHFFTGMSPFF